MGVDLSQFHQVFFEESYEGLDVMESSLLKLDPKAPDDESINEIFRAAHSIKGGSATFGFADIADFTHVVETLLDLIRSGEFRIQTEHVELFLRAVDCIRTMVNELESTKQCSTTQATQLKTSFNAILENLDGSAEVSADAGTTSSEVVELQEQTGELHEANGWKIFFNPDQDMLKTGNDPIRMFRELEELGHLDIKVVLDNMPSLPELDPEACYLAWDLELYAEVEKSKIEEVFEWVIDDADIRIEPLAQSTEGRSEKKESNKASEISEATTSIKAATSVKVTEKTKNAETTASDTNQIVADGNKAAVEAKAVMVGKESKQETSSIRVGTDKLDSLINLVGELVITQSMLNEIGKDFDQSKLDYLLEGLDQLTQHTRDLQESVMRIRMLPISFAFARFPRLVHDMSKSLNKKVELELLGEQTELDKTVMEKIGDPLVHLVRNSLDHGIELPETRLAQNKDDMGKITLNAFHQGGNIMIQIIDDGAGLDEERILAKAIENGLVAESDKLTTEQIHNLIFEPGFSTSQTVTDISGRGVGMDVVRRNIQELNGTVELESTKGSGSTFTIRLPLTLAILDGQLIRVGQQVFIVPLIAIVESIEADKQTIHRVSGGSDVLLIREEYVPIIRLSDTFNIKETQQPTTHRILVIVESENIKVAVQVDELLAQQQVVIKSLQENYRSVAGISGATILGNGSVSLILDINGLIKIADVGQTAYRKINKPDDSVAQLEQT